MPYRKKGTPDEESRRLNNLALQVASLYGGTVKPEYAENIMTSLEFSCSSGHTFTKTIRAVISRGGWCDYCRQDIPANKFEATMTLDKSNWILLSEFSSGKDKIHVRCKLCGLERKGPIRYYEGKPCHHKQISDLDPHSRVEQAVSKLGGKVISASISNLDSQIEFECLEGHRFTLVGRSVVVRRTWCNECSDSGVTHKKINTLIRERGGEVISDIPKRLNASTKVLIRCSWGHEFFNDWDHMKPPRNGWCSICTKGNKSEEIARVTFRQIFGGNFRKARPDWLRNSRGYRMELDGYEENLHLAFEYQGRQHFEHVGMFSSAEKLEQRVIDDQLKSQLCSENGVTLIQLTWNMNYEEFPNAIRNQLLETRPGLISCADFLMPINFNHAFIKDDRLNELREVLETRNLRLLSEKWISVAYKYEIACNECGYRFRQQARSYLNSRKVAGCKKCAMRQTALDSSQRKLGFDALVEVAEFNGGRCLSTEYKSVKSKYEWLCSKGHRFERSLDSIQSKGSFCTPCAFGVPTTNELIQFAEINGGKLNSPEYSGSTVHYSWKCASGHDFFRTWGSMRSSKKFCPSCKK